MTFRSFWKTILPYIKSKYTISLLIFLVWITFYDDLSLIDRVSQIQKIHQLERDKVYYQQKIEEDTRKLGELQGSNANLEKFAREQYLMKKTDEDIFVFEKKNETPQ